MLDPAYVEPVPPVSALAKGAPPCPLHVVEIVDVRRSPEMIGMIGGKPVLAPQDRAAWLRSILEGLKTRGVAADFTNPGGEQPNVANARFALQTAWVSPVQISLNDSAVFRIQATGTDGASLDQYYRGSASRMNWADGDREIKAGMNIAFSRALDDMARDLVKLCKAGPA